jgi:hypothetical protein
LYCWSSQWKIDVAPPEFNAFAIIFVVLLGHAILFAEVIETATGVRIITLVPKYWVYVAVIIFAMPNYFLLLYRGRYKKIIRNFPPEPPALRKRRETAVWIYIYIIVGLTFLVAMVPRRH